MKKFLMLVLLVGAVSTMSGCAATMNHLPLKQVSGKQGGIVFIDQKATGRPDNKNRVGYASLTCAAVPIVPVRVRKGHINEKIMNNIADALKNAGYETTSVENDAAYNGPKIECKVRGLFTYNYTYGFPFVPHWAVYRVTVNLVDTDKKILWTKDFDKWGWSIHILKGHDAALIRAVTATLNDMSKEFAGAEFKAAITKAAPQEVAVTAPIEVVVPAVPAEESVSVDNSPSADQPAQVQ